MDDAGTGKRLPPGVSAREFARALAAWKAIVGERWVFSSEEDLDLYRDAYSPFWDEPEERRAAAAVAPDSVEQVQRILRVANESGIPVYPVSTGRNLGYGGAAPTYSGSVVLDLKRMNRVLAVDEVNANCLVEPGVSYFDMYRHLKATGSKLWIDVPDPGWGSLIGNALDHGGGYTAPAYRNHFEAHCGMEIVLADGEILRTGMGALPGAETWQQYKFSFGPSLDGLFKQSNYGVVTKMGFWLFPEPEAYFSGTVLTPRHDDIVKIVEIFNYLENTMAVHGLPSMYSPAYPMLPSTDPELLALHAAPGGADPAALQAWADRKGLPFWTCSLKFYGAPNVVRALWDAAKARFGAIPGAKFKDGELIPLPLTPEQIARVHKPEFGIPSLEMFYIGARSETNPNPTNGHFWFSPIIPRTGAAVIEANRVIRRTAHELGLPLLMFSPPVGSWSRAFILVLAMPITRVPEEDRRLRAAVKQLIRVCAEHGWGEYRTAPAFMDTVMDVYSYNDHILRRVDERIKDALDPKGILSPGRYGIWPRHLRGERR
ncbi:MAG: FAD-binding oxidoreductase [Steroidobacteraceae bacterium]